MISLKADISQSLQSGFIDRNENSIKDYLPQLVVNDKSENKKVLTVILKELNSCDEFWFSIAFVTTSGIATIIETLIALEHKNVKGKILVSQYLNFTQPEALRRLLKFKNLEIKIAIDNSFHSKGYLFKKNNYYNLIIGSSNLTANALCSNVEWNLKVTALPNSHIIINSLKEFSSEYDKAIFVDSTFLDNYEILYKKQLDYSKIVKQELTDSPIKEIIPNSMQIEALQNIDTIRKAGKNKALLISATGTGKTFLSAFDVKKVNPKKFLFVVHRLNIAQAALRAFRSIFGESKSMGLYSGNQKELDADYVFSTVQTICKEENYSQFERTHFDYIVIDETHRASASSYQRILDYFTPEFLLGMTATPERTDDSDVFKLFDYNIAYEIRLHRALEENILSPFHYYGITDITVDGTILDDNSDFNLLTSNERVNRIIEKIKLYGTDSGKIKGLIFCSKVEECFLLSIAFNERGFRTIALSGDSSEEQRNNAIERLESEDSNMQLDYIFTVEIFNEGVDIPKVNQIIMLRPTQSAIIFVQQLGRGLRKIDDKQYLTVIDFIGNYSNNFLVPIALYGDTSYNKDNLRKLIASGSSLIPGSSTINFDRISKEKIFEAINTSKLQRVVELRKDYQALKSRIGRIPMMIDFLQNGYRDPYHYVNNSRSYYNFVASQEVSISSRMNTHEIKLLELFSSEINNSKRVEESIIIKELIIHGEIKIEDLKRKIAKEYDYKPTRETINSCIDNLNFKFIRKPQKIVYQNDKILKSDSILKKVLSNKTFREFLLDSCNYSIINFNKNYHRNKYHDGLVLYNKYSRKDVCRILNWEEDISSTVYGYRTKYETTPCFITYNKSSDISENINYNDHFIDQSTFAWESRSNRRIGSAEIQNVINSKRILLFIKKADSEGTDFYYIGDAKVIDGSVVQEKMSDNVTPVVYFKYSLLQPVDDFIYEYITSKNYDQDYVSKPNELPQEIEDNLSIESTNLPFEILAEYEIERYKNCIPLFDIKVAAGDFSELEFDINTQWVKLKKAIKYNSDYFICQVLGESMNKIIPSESWCLFKKAPHGSRNGKIILARQSSFQDPDYSSGYTIKEYESEKLINEEGWKHERIILKPKSYNKEFQNIIITEADTVDSNFEIIGEFVEVLQ